MVSTTTPLTPEEGAEIVTAIRAAEKRTGAEIFAVLSRRSGDYRLAALAFLLLQVFLVSFIIAALAWWYWVDVPLPVFAGAQLLAAVAMAFLVSLFPDAAIWCVPKRVRYRRAHASAAQQFLAHGIHHTRGRIGVLVFVSLLERYAEIRADQAIAEKFGQDFWNDAVALLIDDVSKGNVSQGYVRVIGLIGDRLATEFPLKAGDRNELEDRLVIL